MEQAAHPPQPQQQPQPPQQPTSAVNEEQAIALIADAIAKHQAPADSPDFYKSVMRLFKDLNLTPDAEKRLLEMAKQRNVNLKPVMRPSEELPKSVPRIRGPANYYVRTEGDKKEYITVADGKPYVSFALAPASGPA